MAVESIEDALAPSPHANVLIPLEVEDPEFKRHSLANVCPPLDKLTPTVITA